MKTKLIKKIGIGLLILAVVFIVGFSIYSSYILWRTFPLWAFIVLWISELIVGVFLFVKFVK